MVWLFCFYVVKESWLCIHALCISSSLGASQYSHSLLLPTTEQSQRGSWGLSTLFTVITIVEVDDSGCHPSHTDFPRLSGDLNHIQSKLVTLQSQVCFICSGQFASHFCSNVWTCMCAGSGSRSYRLHQYTAAWGLLGWHFQQGAKSLARWSGEYTCHIGTFVCELRNAETQEASQIPPTDYLKGINNTHPYTHSHPTTD